MASKVPDLRFSGFDDSWQNGRFKDIIKTVPFSRFISESHRNGTYPVIQQGENPIAGYADGYPFHNTPNIIIWGDHTRSIYKPCCDFFVASDGVRIFKIDSITPAIIEIILEKYKPASNGYSRHTTLLYKSEFYVPKDSTEQQSIGRFFYLITNLINSQEHLIESLKKNINAFLQNLFPQRNDKQPKLRLDGFSGDWEDKTLNEIVTPYKEIIATPHGGYERLGIRSYGKGTFHCYVPKGAELETAQMNIVRTDNLIVNITFGWELAVAITQPEDDGKLVSHRFPQFSFNEGYVPLFFRFGMINDRLRKHLTLASPGSAGRNRVLKIDKMLEYKMLVPSIEEQKAITNLLLEYDRLIQLNEQKLEKLRNLKQAMLDKMFV